ncbi:MAG: amidohydrolase family protein [Chthoniobacteraceae bacterium]
MKRSTTKPHRIIASHVHTGATFEFLLSEGRLLEKRGVRKKTDIIFGPGLLDLQCNGYAGVDFNHPDTTSEDMADGIRTMWRDGCAHVLPTLITASPERLAILFQRLTAALDSDADVAASVPGFHLEGPFISPQDGARGAHPLAHVRGVSRKIWRDLQRAAEGRIALVTLAPESAGAIPFIRQLRKESVLPAIGHTMADAATIARACEAGALMSTHLGNGCPQLMHRHTNPVLAQLAEDRLAASIIPDGAHLPPEIVRLYRRVKGAERTVLVTDAMAAAGAPSGRYTIGDLVIQIGRDRIARQPGSPNLAGAAITMREAVERYIAMTDAPLAEAWEAASGRAWELLRRSGAVKRIPDSTVLARFHGGKLDVLATLNGRRVLWAA